jgi:acid phosphatase type 7
MHHYFSAWSGKLIAVAIVCGAFWLVASCSSVPLAKVDGRPAIPFPAVAGNTLIVAGDIAECNKIPAADSAAEATAKLVEAIPGLVLTLGDNTYPDGAASEFTDCYQPTWGRFKQRTRPSPGNHDYRTSNAEAYYDYFGDSAGPARRGYYSFDYAGWHLISLNSNIDAENDSAQMQWLRQDLAASKTRCTIAYWHHPVFSSGSHGNDNKMKAVWNTLHEAGADIVLNGHDHHYERFASQDITGNLDTARGMREFLIGTGGVRLYKIDDVKANSEVRENATHGVVKFTLGENDYRWEFIPVEGSAFRDSGTGSCH